MLGQQLLRAKGSSALWRSRQQRGRIGQGGERQDHTEAIGGDRQDAADRAPVADQGGGGACRPAATLSVPT